MPQSPSTTPRRLVASKTSIAPGDALGGKFRVERILGRGGMGVVVEATNMQLGQTVAVKLLLSGADDPAIVERFTGEARAAARLKSDHVARVYDVGSDDTHGPFIVMEMLDGMTLGELISTSGRVPVQRAVEHVIDACEGLAEAHARGIIHQDVKPANLFLITGSDGRPAIKLLDFGIATMRSRGQPNNARSSQPTTGTPAYLAPEQLRATGSVDHRADIWALGCVLYELLVGERPFRASRFTELVTAILESPPHPFPAGSDVPHAVQALVLRCLDKDRDKRFASTGELGLALLPFARRRAHTAVSRAVSHVKNAGLDPHLEMPSSMPPRPSDTDIDALTDSQLRPSKVPVFDALPAEVRVPIEGPRSGRSRVALGAVAAFAVALIAAVGWFSWSRPRAGDGAPPSATSSVAVVVPVPTPSIPSATTSNPTPENSSASNPPANAGDAANTASAAREPTAPRSPPPPFTGFRRTRPLPSAAGSAVPTSPDAEIRHNR